MALINKNDRLEEIGLVVGDKLFSVDKKWWYALGIAVILFLPLYFVAKWAFVNRIISEYQPPKIIYNSPVKEPLQVLEKKIFSLGNNTYNGYAKVKNINLEWGVGSQAYTAEFKTLGGTSVNTVSATTFVMPSSEKLIVLPRFISSIKPDVINLNLVDTHFLQKPNVAVNLELERVNVQNNPDGLLVYGGVKNLMPYTIRKMSLSAAVYNNKNEIVAVNYTYINDVKSGETRTFQFSWPSGIDGAVRAEVNPEVNIFDHNIFATEEGISPFLDRAP